MREHYFKGKKADHLALTSPESVKKQNLLKDFTHPTFALSVPLIAMDFATVCIGIYLYAHKLGGFDANDYPGSYMVVFWVYFVVALFTSIPVTVGWFGSVGQDHELRAFSLTGCFLVFPLVSWNWRPASPS